MTRHVRYALGSLIVILMVALSFAGIGPAQAQQDQPTQTPGAMDQDQQDQNQQGGNTITIQTSDTLGSILGRFNLTEEQMRQFLVANANLALDTGQTITFPAGVTIAAGNGTEGQVGGAGQTTATPSAGSEAGQTTATPGAEGQATATPEAGAAGQTTATPGAGEAGGTGAAGQAGFNCAAGQANPGQTYLSQEGDTLGDILMMMGLDVQAEINNAGGNTGQGDQQGQDAQATGTPTGDADQGAGNQGAQATGTPTGVADQGAGNQGQQGGQQGQVNTNRVVEFIYLNCDLRFDAEQDQTVVVPAGIPQTGAGQQGGQQGQGAQQGQVYNVQAGETLTEIANRFGVTLEALVAANPNLLQAGQTINIPAQQGNIPQTGQQAQQGQGTFGARLRHPYADPENVGHLGIYVVRGGDNLTNIARRFGTSIEELRAMNPHIQNPDLIFTGQWILLHPGEQVLSNPPNWQSTGENQNQ